MRVVRLLGERPPSFLLLLPPCSPDIILVSAARLAGVHLPASLDCICRLVLAVYLVGLLQRDQICGPTRTCTSGESLWASPDFSGAKIVVGLAGLFAPRKSSWASLDFYAGNVCA